ncbi:MAG: TIGR04283 family arsenosugar biosynthesis glycosyltransferase, partial [Candidatus Paceibacterota bacterium]
SMSDSEISVIIPVYNEENTIGKLLSELKKRSRFGLCEIVVVDGGSTDRTRKIAEEAGATVIESEKKGRAAQMNAGAAYAQAEILYFLHADTIPPYSFDAYILKSVANGFGAGCFSLCFDDPHPGLRFYSWFTKFGSTLIRFGDQSLFVKSKIFKEVNGFDGSLIVMEDQQIVRKIKRVTRFRVINEPVLTSARKYRKNGVYRLQAVFFLIWAGYYFGFSQQVLTYIYQKYIN